VPCDHCGFTYYYELARIGAGANTASYGIGSSSASKKAQDQSESDLQRRLAVEAELVPCPRCQWISDELVQGYRLGRYRGVGKLAFAIGFAGSILSLIVAWFIHIGLPGDRWLLPYLLIGGPATFMGIAMTLLVLRGWLRGRIQPNWEFPQQPRLPPGTPPALILDETTQNLRPARTSASVDAFLDYQCGRHMLPPLCCECLQPGNNSHGYSIQLTRLIRVKIPRCVACAGKSEREWRRISLIFMLSGMFSGATMVVIMVMASVQLWIIIVSALGLLAGTLALLSVVAEARTAPVKVAARDRSRGVVGCDYAIQLMCSRSHKAAAAGVLCLSGFTSTLLRMVARSLACLTLVVAGFIIGCTQNDPPEKKAPTGGQRENKVANQPEQKITALNESDQKLLRDQRAVVEKYLGNEDSKEKYKTAAGKLGTIRAILQSNLFKPDQKYKLQCLGIVLGDVFVQDMGMEWIMVEDEYGRAPAVRLPNTTIILYPMTMISKRIERSEKVDVFE
jgi:hypothetical protein